MCTEPLDVFSYIKQHSDIFYCEAVVYPDGTIEDCVPSHQQKLLSIAGINNAWDVIPLTASPTHWLVEHTHCVALWYDIVMYHDLTKRQLDTLKALVNNKVISHKSNIVYTNEKSKIYTLETNIDHFEEFLHDSDMYRLECEYVLKDIFEF